LDINNNPNAPSNENITPQVLLPGVEMNIATSYGNFLRIASGYYTQHYAHLNGTSNYLDYSRFQMSAVRSSNTYTTLSATVLNNLKIMIEKSEASEDWGTYLAATTLRAFTYSVLVDCYGELPYTEALDPTNAQPKYDDGKTIYEGVIAELDAALEKGAGYQNTIASSFLFPTNHYVTPWVSFAKALKLRMLMRMADVPGADVKGKLDALVAAGGFPTADVRWTDCWANEPTKMSPFYAEEFATNWGSNQKNVAANVAIIQTMQVTGYTDPRLARFFTPNSKNVFIGSVSGTQYPGNTKLTNWCRPVANWDMPVNVITLAEIQFLLAEYQARWGTPEAAATHYANAITASFTSAGVASAATAAAAHVDRYPYDQANYKQRLGIEKWVALSGVNTFEAWCEMRRLGYPTFGTAKGSEFYTQGDDATFDTSSYVPGTLYTPIEVFNQVGDNKILERFPYAESSTSRNPSAPAFPGYTEPVFWAVN
jgi:hypothetical protein